MLVFLAVLATIAAYWLAQQGLTAKPWLQEGVPVGPGAPRRVTTEPAKLGLGLFLAVAGALFVLLISSYFMRKGLPDWRPLTMPPLLWVTTGVLAASSLLLWLAGRSAERGSRDETQLALSAGAATAIVFVAGQMAAWRQMLESGFGVAGNPSNTFFFLLTGVHALHVLGGLGALAWTFEKTRKARDLAGARSRIELCSLYWDFLLVVWLVLLAILTGFADGLGEICGRLLS